MILLMNPGIVQTLEKKMSITGFQTALGASTESKEKFAVISKLSFVLAPSMTCWKK
jgi:hypothetical protein